VALRRVRVTVTIRGWQRYTRQYSRRSKTVDRLYFTRILNDESWHLLALVDIVSLLLWPSIDADARSIFVDVIGLALDIVLMLRSQAVTAGCPICEAAGGGVYAGSAFGEDGEDTEESTSANKLIADELVYCSIISPRLRST